MEEALALIDKILEEHKQITRRIEDIEQVANDATALLKLEGTKEDFVPGRFAQGESLKKLESALATIDKGLQEHFEREEKALLKAFEKHGGRALVETLSSLLSEHENLRNRFTHAKKHVAELIGGELSRHQWEASANDMRAHISHTRKLLEAHAQSEQKLLETLRNQLRKGEKR